MSELNKAAEVFEALGDCILQDLKNPEKATPGVYQAALRYCKDAGLEQLPVPGSKAQQVHASLPFPRAATA